MTTKRTKQMEIKVYVVLKLLLGVPADRPNVKIEAVRLTKRAAEIVAENTERSWIERFISTK